MHALMYACAVLVFRPRDAKAYDRAAQAAWKLQMHALAASSVRHGLSLCPGNEMLLKRDQAVRILMWLT